MIVIVKGACASDDISRDGEPHYITDVVAVVHEAHGVRLCFDGESDEFVDGSSGRTITIVDST